MDLLKGNFQTAENPKAEEATQGSDYRKKALENIGGSMVFVERKLLEWDDDTGFENK